MLELIKTIKLKNVSLNPQSHPCFLYDFESLGVTPNEVARALEGMWMDIFAFTTRSKKNWKQQVVTMQRELYSKLMKKVKSNKHNYFSHAVLFGATCQFCNSPVVEDRAGMCALPESARNKMRSLKLLGFSADNFDPEWLHNVWMCGVIYAKKGD